MKLLCAEDEPAMAEAVTDILNYHNFMVDAVPDGEETLEYALSGDCDGIILDIMPPKKAAWRCCTSSGAAAAARLYCC